VLRKVWSLFLTAMLVMPAGPAAFGANNVNFFDLCSNGTPEEVKAALQAGADVNAKDDDGDTALMWCAENEHSLKTLSILIKAGADVNAKDNDGWTPLMFAAKENTPEALNALIAAGADVNAQNNDGKTALALAKEKEEPDYNVITLLSEHEKRRK
jgi:ankyrin repeat protein